MVELQAKEKEVLFSSGAMHGMALIVLLLLWVIGRFDTPDRRRNMLYCYRQIQTSNYISRLMSASVVDTLTLMSK